MYRRRYQLRPVAIEFLDTEGQTLFIGLNSETER